MLGICENKFPLEDWESLWKLLAVITVRKCSKKRRKYSKESTRRSTAPVREDSLDGGDWIMAIDVLRPPPAEAAALTETVSRLFQASFDPEDREMAECILQGYTAVEIGERYSSIRADGPPAP